MKTGLNGRDRINWEGDSTLDKQGDRKATHTTHMEINYRQNTVKGQETH